MNQGSVLFTFTTNNLCKLRTLLENERVEVEKYLDFSSRDEIFWKIFEHGKMGIAVTDAEGNILIRNDQFTNMVFKKKEHVSLQALIDTHTISSLSMPGIQKVDIKVDSEIVRLTQVKVGDDTHGPAYLWLAGKDNHAALTKKLGLLKNIYRSFIDTTFEVMFRTSADGSIHFCNHLFLKTFGFTNYRDVKHTKITSLFSDPLVFEALKNRVEKEKRVVSERILFKRPNSSIMHGLINCSSYQDQGTVVFNWTVLDITQQVESEFNLLKKNEELAKVNHHMEKFLYSTSHDLRSPLTSILGLVNLMRVEVKESAVLDYIDKVELSTLKLDKIIKDIVSFSKATYQRSYSEKIDFEALIWKVVNGYHQDPAMRKINIEIKVATGFPYYSDPERLEIIIDNLIRNCIHFYDGNKARPFIRVNATIEKTKATIEIFDNGIGIGQTHLSQIFNIFYKASHLSKGAGLGLFIVKETIEKMNGSITVESEIGFGTMIKLFIPNDHKGQLIGRKLQLQNTP